MKNDKLKRKLIAAKSLLSRYDNQLQAARFDPVAHRIAYERVQQQQQVFLALRDQYRSRRDHNTCPRCGATLTSADTAAGKCTQCAAEINL